MPDQHLRLTWLVSHLGPSVDLSYSQTDKTFQHFLYELFFLKTVENLHKRCKHRTQSKVCSGVRQPVRYWSLWYCRRNKIQQTSEQGKERRERKILCWPQNWKGSSYIRTQLDFLVEDCPLDGQKGVIRKWLSQGGIHISHFDYWPCPPAYCLTFQNKILTASCACISHEGFPAFSGRRVYKGNAGKSYLFVGSWNPLMGPDG